MSYKTAFPAIPRRTAILGLLALGGCGFAPVYGNDGAGTALRGTVALTTPDTVAGFRLREQLTARLGTADAPRYMLDVTLSETRRPATITPDGDTTRFNLIGTANWTLIDTATATPVESGAVDAFTSYAATGSTVATQAAETDARARLSVALADLIVARLLILAPGLTT